MSFYLVEAGSKGYKQNTKTPSNTGTKRPRSPQSYDQSYKRYRLNTASNMTSSVNSSIEQFSPFSPPDASIGLAWNSSRPQSQQRDHSITFTGNTTFTYSATRSPSPALLRRRPRLLSKAKSSKAQEKKHTCPHCGHDKVFSTANDLDRHLKTVHGIIAPGEKIWICKIPGCSVPQKVWARLDNFKQHVIRMHGIDYADDAEAMSEEYDLETHGRCDVGKAKVSRMSSRQDRTETPVISVRDPKPSIATKHKVSEIKLQSEVGKVPRTTPGFGGDHDAPWSLRTQVQSPFVLDEFHFQPWKKQGSNTVANPETIREQRRDLWMMEDSSRAQPRDMVPAEADLAFTGLEWSSLSPVRSTCIRGLSVADKNDGAASIPNSLSDHFPGEIGDLLWDGQIDESFLPRTTSPISQPYEVGKSASSEVETSQHMKAAVPLSEQDVRDFVGPAFEYFLPPNRGAELPSKDALRQIASNREGGLKEYYPTEPERERSVVNPIASHTVENSTLMENNDSITRVRTIVSSALTAYDVHYGLDFSTAAKATFCFRWPLNHHTDSKLVNDSSFQTLSKIVTLTGSVTKAQALPCLQYLEQEWPNEGCNKLLELVQQACTGEPGFTKHFKLEDGKSLHASQDNNSLSVEVEGTFEQILCVAEQLSWLGAALQSTRGDHALTYCTPSISMVSLVSQTKTPTFNIDFQFDTIATDLKSQGMCWEALFHRAVLVKGFPVRPRPNTTEGLEIPLNMVAALVGTRSLSCVNDDVFFKGYSTMLIPTKMVDDVLLWHHCGKGDSGKHISYDSHDTVSRIKVSSRNLLDLRHIVGWCKRADCRAATVDATYDIGPSHLEPAGKTCILDSCKLSVPLELPADSSFVFTHEHQTPAARSEELPNVFRRLGGIYVLFYDTQYNRGWLVDGITATLHLVLASITSDERRSFGADDFKWKWTDLKIPADAHGVGSARRLLGIRSNRRSSILTKHDSSENDAQYETLWDRVIQFYHVMDVAFHHQHVRLQQLESSPRSRLEGWDFHELAEQTPTTEARKFKLPAAGMAWVDLIRSLEVITIFGRGFGELITPSKDSVCCSNWTNLPVNRAYIALRNYDILEILRCKAVQPPNAHMLTPSLIWHNPGSLHNDCGHSIKDSDGSGFVQMPWPKDGPRLHAGNDAPIASLISTKGATVFGHAKRVGWHWTDQGNPIKGVPVDSSETPIEFRTEDAAMLEAETPTTFTKLSGALQQNFVTPLTPSSVGEQHIPAPGKVYGDSTIQDGSHHFGDKIKHKYNITIYYLSEQQLNVQPVKQHMPQQQLEDFTCRKEVCVDDLSTCSRRTKRIRNMESEPRCELANGIVEDVLVAPRQRRPKKRKKSGNRQHECSGSNTIGSSHTSKTGMAPSKRAEVI